MKKIIFLSLLVLFFTEKISAQYKFKSAQTTNLRAPANIKADGKLTEWTDSLQAFNSNTKLYYTLSNDDNFLYLTIKSTDATNNAKIQAGGITFTLNPEGKKKTEDAFVVTYPVISRPTRAQRGTMRPGGGPGFAGGAMVFGTMGPGGTRTAATDSMIDAAHKQFIASSKLISVTGFKDVTDSLISIYNEYNIKAAIGFNKEGNFIYELALPLSTMGLSTAKLKEIAYNVKLNGLVIPNRPDNPNEGGGGGFGGGGGGFNGGGGGPGGAGGVQTRVVRIDGQGGSFGGGGGNRFAINFQDMISPTDFWGKYTLAK
jgi:hypothetical protein